MCETPINTATIQKNKVVRSSQFHMSMLTLLGDKFGGFVELGRPLRGFNRSGGNLWFNS